MVKVKIVKSRGIWVWRLTLLLAAISVVIGGYLLYPISNTNLVENIIFIVAKIGMIVGIFLYFFDIDLIMRAWTDFTIIAILMTCIKWYNVGFQWIFILAIIVDIMFPILAFTVANRVTRIEVEK
jgi:hypothetical protein